MKNHIDNESFNSDQSFDSIQLLGEDEILNCFRGDTIDPDNYKKWNESLQKEELTQCVVDQIASFNIQNRYDHTMAAELMIKENFSFIAFQEPHASHYKKNQKWHDFQKRELASARLSVFETQHQIIMYDNWKWGGREISSFESHQNGRIATIAFGFGNHQQLGIISLYGISESNGNSEEEKRTKSNVRNTTTFLVKKIMKQWKHQFPKMGIIIMGDLQETVTKSDKDNLGLYRQDMLRNGILKTTSESHISFVRENVKTAQYLTRFGSKGARGIDHILVPVQENIFNWFSGGKVDDQIATKYFPSDHNLITCSFTRYQGNNRETSGISKSYDYKKLFQIKLKRSGDNGEDLDLDTSQFKDSRSFRKQAKLFNKIRNLTEGSSHESNHYLPRIEKRITKLYKSLWLSGIKQNANGKKNKLVEINENQALSLSHALRGFNESVKAIMHNMELEKDRDIVATGGTIRKSVHDGKGFKMFQNLPISTKLRYLQSSIRGNIRKLQRITNSIHRWRMRNPETGKTGAEMFNYSDLNDVMDSVDISLQAEKIRKEYYAEVDERTNHMQAIESFKSRYRVQREDDGSATIKKESPNQNLCDNELNLKQPMLKLINAWLADGGCNQGFNSEIVQDRFSFLEKQKINEWKNRMLHWNEDTLPLHSNENRELFVQGIDDTVTKLKRTLQNTKLAQREYKVQTLEFFIKTNKISAFTNKVLPKNREAPVPHNSIWDNRLRKMRRCKNEEEEMVATGQHHNHWMSPSKATESCAFASVVKVGNLGPRGVKLHPNRTVTENDISKLINRGEALPSNIKKEFILAHGKHIAKLFQEPTLDREEFFYPFYLINEEGCMQAEEDLKENFMKSLSCIPGKARHEGFQMAVIGRFGKRWRNVLFNLIKLIFIMRYVPPDIKKISRFPIPKPGKLGEYRPISLCHDIYCFLNAISTAITSKGIEKAGILHSGIASYREGMGCMNLVGVEQAFREDCLESGRPAAQIDEDEEKFFDRIPLEIILAAMRICGFPTQGFLELKANCMDSKYVEIITNKGTAIATFSCGLEQGNPDSPTVANLVILLKHKLWNSICEEFLETRGGIKDKFHSYTFHISDDKDGKLVIKMMGYCDDNSRFLSLLDEQDLITLTKKFIQLTGDLSMVTKIGRKGSKSEIHFYNLSAETAFALREWETTAWSFTTDTPTKEYIPIKFSLQKCEEDKLLKRINNVPDLSEDDKAKWFAKIFPEEHRHLGITTTLKGITQGTKERVIKKIKKRIIELNTQKMGDAAQQLCNNMLCTTVHSYAPLQCGYTANGLIECDSLVASSLRSKKSLSKSDAMHRFWIDEKYGGFGFKSFLEEDIISVGRELEVILNSNDLDSKALRGRLQAFRKQPKSNTMNHIRDAVEKLAKYGIFIRDSSDDLMNFVLAGISKLPKYAPIGSAAFKSSNKAGIGCGKDRLLDLKMGGTIETIVKMLLAGETENNIKEVIPGRLPISIEAIKKEIKRARSRRFMEATKMYKFWEWTYTKARPTIPQDLAQWEYVDMSKKIIEKYPNSYLNLSTNQILEECNMGIQIKVEHNVSWKNSPKITTRYSEAMTKLIHSDSPLLIATDGSHIPDKIHQPGKTSAAFVACMLNIEDKESICESKWEERMTEPLMARILDLPHKIGTEKTDIAHGEACAIWFQEATFSKSAARCVITDSEAVRKCIMKVRNEANETMNRKYIRTLASGISKLIIGKFRESYTNNSSINSSEERCKKFLLCKSTLELRLSVFIKKAKAWSNINKDVQDTKNSEERKLWPPSYWDDHDVRPILKINSHQLNQHGSAQKVPPRYPNLIPKLAPLHSNHLADICASLTIDQKRHGGTESTEDDIEVATSNQRFFLSWEGKTLDKNIAQRMRKIFQCEKMKRLRSKATQGLLWRLMPDSTTHWNTICRHKGWLRSVAGFSNSHTRALYKSECYRNGNWLENHREEIQNGATCKKTEKITRSLQCKWCNIQNKKRGKDSYGNETKGNRTHHMHFCQHKDLKEFREHIEELMEQHLNRLIQKFQSIEGVQKSEALLNQVCNTFAELQSSMRGCLKRPPTCRSNAKTGHQWKKEHGVPSIIEGIRARRITYIQLFNIVPISGEEGLQDKYIGIGDSMLFGIIPRAVDTVIRSAIEFKSSPLPKSITDKTALDITEIWATIQELLIARTTGLHRLMSTICKAKETGWKQKFQDQLAIQSIGVIRRNARDMVSTNKRKCPAKKTGETSTHPDEVRKKRKKMETSIMKSCAGITCRPCATDHQVISVMEKKQPNMIKQGKLHCQRCAKHQTAMRQSREHLQLMQEESSSKQNELFTIINTCISQHSNDYNSLMNLLDDERTKEINSKALFKSKKRRISDQEKTMCKVIIKEAQQEDNIQPQHLRIKKCINNIQDTLTQHVKAMKKDVQYERNILKQEMRTSITQGADKQKETTCDAMMNEQADVEAKRLQQKALMMTRWQRFSGFDLDKDIAITKNAAPTGTYFADQDAMIIINLFQLTDEWSRFGRMFKSVGVRSSKPQGHYIIPLFWGNHTSGHWTVVIIWRAGRRNRGFHLDPLGKSSVTGPVFEKIKNAFTGKRDKFTWTETNCFPQTELECGFRTVEAIRLFCKEKSRGTPTKECIQVASFANYDAERYCSLRLRERVAERLWENHNAGTRDDDKVNK